MPKITWCRLTFPGMYRFSHCPLTSCSLRFGFENARRNCTKSVSMFPEARRRRSKLTVSHWCLSSRCSQFHPSPLNYTNSPLQLYCCLLPHHETLHFGFPAPRYDNLVVLGPNAFNSVSFSFIDSAIECAFCHGKKTVN